MVDEILKFGAAAVDERVLFLAAQTLNRKIRYDRIQVGESDQAWFSLRSAVIGHLMIHNSRAVVATQLCLALVALLIQMETWHGGIQDLITGLKHNNPSMLLECLKLIPQEVDDQSLDVSSTRRFAFKTEMLDSSKAVLALLSEVRQLVPFGLTLDCLTSWLMFADIEFHDLIQSPLLEMCFQCDVNKPKELESSVQVLVESCYCYRDEREMLQFVVPRISSHFGPVFTSGTFEQRNELAKLFAHCAEAFERTMQTSFHGELINLACQVYIAKDYYLARKVMYFWMDFLGAVYENRLGNYPELLPTLEVLFQASFQRMLPGEDDDEDEDIDDDSTIGGEEGDGGDVDMRSDLEQHRYETRTIVQTVLACGDVDFVLRVAEPKFVSCIQQAQQFTLQQIEAMFRVFHSSVRYLQSHETIVFVLQAAFRYSGNAMSIRKIACDVVAELCEYHIATKPEIYLETCLKFVLESLQHPKCETHAARAFRTLCLNTTLAPQLSTVLETVLLPHPSFANLQRTHARTDCLEALTRLYVTLSFAPNNNSTVLFQRLVGPLWEQVSSALLQEDMDALSNSLDCITIVIQASVGSAQEIVPQEVILSKLWVILPLLTQVHERAVEHIGRVIKHAFRTYPAACRAQGKLIIEFIVKRFRFHPVSGLLYITGAFFQEYFACEELAQSFPEVFALLTQLSFDLVLNSLDAFVQHPHFVEDLYYLANRTVENSPEVLVQFNDATFVRLVGMASEIGVVLEHREAFRSVAVFLDNSIAILGANGKLRPYMSNALEVHGAALVRNLIHGLCGTQAAERVADPQASGGGTIAHVLLALFEFWEGHRFEHLVSQCLAQQTHLSQEMRSNFAPNFIKAALEQGMHQITTVCTEFADSARRRKLRVITDK